MRQGLHFFDTFQEVVPSDAKTALNQWYETCPTGTSLFVHVESRVKLHTPLPTPSLDTDQY
jgi:hypothetical protein